MFGFDKMFDFNRDGKLDSWERAAQFQFMDEMMKNDEKSIFDDDDKSDIFADAGLDYDELSLPERWECTCRIYRSLGYKPVNLSACCEREGIELKHHEALSDARGCAKLYLNFLEKYRPLSTLW